MIHSIIKGLRSFYITISILFVMFIISLCFFHGTLANSITYIKNQFEKENMKIEFTNHIAAPFSLMDNMFENMEGKDF